MNAPSVPRREPARKIALAWSVSIVVMGLLLVSVWTLLPLGTNNSETRRPLPAGQLQADARTLFAALNFLLDRDSDSASPAVTAFACPTNFAAQPAASTTFCCLSNQAELLFEPITNLPGRS